MSIIDRLVKSYNVVTLNTFNNVYGKFCRAYNLHNSIYIVCNGEYMNICEICDTYNIDFDELDAEAHFREAEIFDIQYNSNGYSIYLEAEY